MGRFGKYVSSLSAGGDGKVWDLGWNGASTRSHSWLMRVLRSDGDELEEDEDLENQRKRQKGYDPFSDEPTPLALRRKRRK